MSRSTTHMCVKAKCQGYQSSLLCSSPRVLSSPTIHILDDWFPHTSAPLLLYFVRPHGGVRMWREQRKLIIVSFLFRTESEGMIRDHVAKCEIEWTSSSDGVRAWSATTFLTPRQYGRLLLVRVCRNPWYILFSIANVANDVDLSGNLRAWRAYPGVTSSVVEG